jgi:hypothetical protein
VTEYVNARAQGMPQHQVDLSDATLSDRLERLCHQNVSASFGISRLRTDTYVSFQHPQVETWLPHSAKEWRFPAHGWGRHGFRLSSGAAKKCA